MSGGFFRGTSADQDTRFSNKQAKLLKSQKFSPVLDQLVDMTKVKMDVMKPWIATRATELVGFEDEVLINFIYGLLDGKGVDGKQIQIQLTGFMEKNTGKFMRELWSLLLSAQSNVSGVPQQFLDAKEEETRKKKEESDKITQEIQKRMDRDGRRPEKERRSRFGDEADLSKFTKDASGGVGSKFSEPKDSSMEHVDGEADKRHGSLSENRRSRTPPSKTLTPSPQTIPSPTRSNDKKSMSRSRSISEERPKRRSPSVSSQSPKHSISPRKRYLSPNRRSLSPRKRYLSPNRRSISPRKRYSSPNRRSISPRRRYRSPHRSRYRSPRDSRSPPRRRSTYLRRRSPSPYRGRSPIPRRRSPRRRSPSPARRRSPSPARRRSPSPARRRLSPVRRRSPSPVHSISPSPVRSISPSPVRRRSPPLQHRSPKKYRRSPSPSLSPLPRSPKRSGSPYKPRSSLSPSRRSPVSRSSRHRELSPMRSPGHRHADSSLSPPQRKRNPSPYRSRSNISLSTKHDDRLNDGKITERGDVKKSPAKASASLSYKMQISLRSPQRDAVSKSKTEKKSPIASPEHSLNRSISPTDMRKEDGRIRRRSPNLSRSPIRKTRKEEHMNHDREVTHNRIARSGRTGKDSPKDMKPEPYSPKRRNFSRSPEPRNDKRRKSELGPVEKHAETHNPRNLSEIDNAAGKARHDRGSREHVNDRRSSELLRKMDDESYDTKQQKSDNERHPDPKQAAALPNNRMDSDSGDSYKNDRRSKRSDKHKGDSEETSESDSEAEHKKEAKRKRREEKRLRREERHKKREERHRRKLERRASKLKLKSTERDASDADDSEAEQKRLEVELREKALESLRAKKGISH